MEESKHERDPPPPAALPSPQIDGIEDREDLPSTPKSEKVEAGAVASAAATVPEAGEETKELDGTVSQFESLESIIYYLEMEYGLEKFKEIYEVVKQIDEKQKGDIVVEEYLQGLEGIVEREKILRNLFLFISLKRTEEQALTS